MTSHPFELQARFMMSFIACNFGFFKITNHGSKIPCEMLAYYLYYRISCMFGIWIHLGVQDGHCQRADWRRQARCRRRR